MRRRPRGRRSGPRAPARARRRAPPRPERSTRGGRPRTGSRAPSSCMRERSAELSSKYGFSVVAPIRVTRPSSMPGRSASCCALLKRWISSRNRIVRRPSAPSRSPGPRQHLADVRDRRRHCRELLELGAGRVRDDARQRRLARPGRPEEDERRDAVGLDRGAEGPPRPDDVGLADEAVERGRAQPLGERGDGLESAACSFVEEVGHIGSMLRGVGAQVSAGGGWTGHSA